MLILASASPRRVQLLRQAGLDPKVVPSKAPESRRKGEGPRAMVLRLAQLKAFQVAVQLSTKGVQKGLVLAADTTVALGTVLLEKPKSSADAVRMLSRLSGKSHTIHTGVAFFDLRSKRQSSFVEATEVYFRKLSQPEIRAYVATGEPMDKAGAYGIQGGAAAFVRRIEGDYSNVVGLPLARVLESLRSFA